MTLRTRKPTGQVAYPIVLVEGAEKVGKTYTALALSASEKVGRTFVFDIGEGSADEYAPLGRYEVVEHDGTFTDFIGQLEAATAEPAEDGKPNVIVIDSGTMLWEGLKNWASKRARNSRSNKALLAKDPDAEINVSSTYWNDANDRWGRMLRILRAWPGIAVVVCRGKEVSVMGADGNPIPGRTEYRVEAQKQFPYNASVHVRVEAPGVVKLTAVRSLSVTIPAKGLALPGEASLEHALFEVVSAGTWSVADVVDAQFGRTALDAKNELTELLNGDKAAAAEVWKAGPCPNAVKTDEVSDADWHALEAAARERLVPPADDAESEPAPRPAPPVPGGEA